MSLDQSSILLKQQLTARYENLKRMQDLLYSAQQDSFLDMYDADQVDNSSEDFVQISQRCKALWKHAERLQMKLKDADGRGNHVTEYCTKFVISETWLDASMQHQGDTASLNTSTEEDCLTSVKRVFPDLGEEKQSKMAKDIVNLNKLCRNFFVNRASNVMPEFRDGDIVTLQAIRDVHALLIGKPGSQFRDHPSSNDLGLPYVDPQHISIYLTILVEFVNENCKKEEVSLKERILLASLFFERFLWIHPFEDGNGRTARALVSIILRDVCKTVPLPLFLRSLPNPKEFYIRSIRANPSGAPVCLAFYILKCLTENSARILDAIPLTTTESKDDDEKQAEGNVLSGHTLMVWRAISDGFKSVRPNHVEWLSQNPGSFLVIRRNGESTLVDKNAIVDQVTSFHDVLNLTRNQSWASAKVFSHAEFFSEFAEILISKPAPESAAKPPIVPCEV